MRTSLVVVGCFSSVFLSVLAVAQTNLMYSAAGHFFLDQSEEATFVIVSEVKDT
jgi:hypothetical protein